MNVCFLLGFHSVRVELMVPSCLAGGGTRGSPPSPGQSYPGAAPRAKTGPAKGRGCPRGLGGSINKTPLFSTQVKTNQWDRDPGITKRR